MNTRFQPAVDLRIHIAATAEARETPVTAVATSSNANDSRCHRRSRMPRFHVQYGLPRAPASPSFSHVLAGGAERCVDTDAGTRVVTWVRSLGAQCCPSMAVHLPCGQIISGARDSTDLHRNLAVIRRTGFTRGPGSIPVLEHVEPVWAALHHTAADAAYPQRSSRIQFVHEGNRRPAAFPSPRAS